MSGAASGEGVAEIRRRLLAAAREICCAALISGCSVGLALKGLPRSVKSLVDLAARFKVSLVAASNIETAAGPEQPAQRSLRLERPGDTRVSKATKLSSFHLIFTRLLGTLGAVILPELCSMEHLGSGNDEITISWCD